MFKKVKPQENFPALERRILKFWQKNKIFERSVKERPAEKQFTFYDGPPFATGLPHYGHILAGVLKDVVPRYWTMKGFRVERRFGWDCHGLPVEYEAEKELKISGKKDIEKLGIVKFNDFCRSIVLRYVKEWRTMTERIGRFVDMDHDYKTMEPWYMESIWWVFATLYKKGLIYEGYKVLPFCPRCSTPLSNFETSLGYQTTQDPSIYVKFPLQDQEKTFYLVWTTTPWTLPGNAALALHPQIKYVKVKQNDEFLILAKERLKALKGKYELVAEFSGQELLKDKKNVFYQPLYNTSSLAKPKTKVYQLILADFVSLEEGTGIVHIAPAFGEEDYNVGYLQKRMAVLMTVDETGKVIKGYQIPGEGLFIKEADEKIINDLRKRNLLYQAEVITHSYPFCWRCETPLIYRATSTWFVKVSAIKNLMLKNNENIHWVPGHLKHGRFQKGIESAPDWAISRNRYWGNPLPVWKCSCGRIKVISSISELEKLSGQKVKDLHKQFVDQITLPCSCGKRMKRIPEILDCWFESGAMPYAQKHYLGKPLYDFDPQKKLNFPADFIAEGLDQTRGWFYTLHVLSNALFQSEAFKNVIVNGIILAEDGQKMSKRLKNYPDPQHIIETYGADALRFYLLSSPAVKAQDLRFSEKGVEEVVKKLILPLWNSYRFFVTYATIDRFSPPQNLVLQPKHILDRWIISRLEILKEELTKQMDAYRLDKATSLLVEFLDDLSNWYIRRSRRRFWKSEDDQDKKEAYLTLYYLLTNYALLLAPFTPFVAEEIYKNLTNQESVHLAFWPPVKKELIDLSLVKEVDLARRVVEEAHASRAAAGIKVRQPLARCWVYAPQKIGEELKEVIKEEINVKEIVMRKAPVLKVKLETKIDEALKLEGLARELVRYIQEMRKRADFKVDDRIVTYLKTKDAEIKKAALAFEDYIKRETLSLKLIFQKNQKAYNQKVKIDQKEVEIGVMK